MPGNRSWCSESVKIPVKGDEKMRCADLIVDALRREGVKFVAGYPGGGVGALVDALVDVPRVRSILVRHERVAADMADGYARVSGEPGVILASTGAGAAHAFAGLAQSYADSVPVLLLCGHVYRRVIGTETVQEINNLDVFRSVTKWSASLNLPQRTSEMMRRAFTALRSGRGRPVMLEVPWDLAMDELPTRATDSTSGGASVIAMPERYKEVARYRPVKERICAGADPVAVERAAELLVRAKSPVLYAGAGVLFAQASEELRILAEMLSTPVMTTLNGKSVFPENHPLALGMGGYPRGIFGTKPAAVFARKADVVFAIGNSFKRPATQELPIPRGVKLIHSGADEFDLNKMYQADVAILGDAKLVLQAMVEAVKSIAKKSQLGVKRSVTAEIKKVKEQWLAEWKPKLTSDEVPINPYRVTWDLMRAVDREKTIVLHDSGNSRGQVSHHYEALVPRGYLGMGGQSEMGWSLGAAMGARLARPDMLVVNVMGDGAFGMTGLDIETAVRNEIPIICIVINNSVLGITKLFQKRPHRVELGGDYAKVAEGLGAFGERVEQPAEIIPAIERAKRAVREGKPAVLDVIIKEEGLPILK